MARAALIGRVLAACVLVGAVLAPAGGQVEAGYSLRAQPGSSQGLLPPPQVQAGLNGLLQDLPRWRASKNSQRGRAANPQQAPALSAAGSPGLAYVLANPPASEPAPAPPAPPRPTANLVGGVPFVWQDYALSCESAALEMALGHEGVNTSQDQILDIIGSDLRWARWDENGMRWGDPYQTFVGYVGGSEDYLTGYGTYYPAIARVAQALGGRVLRAEEGIAPADVYNALLDGHPVVLWIAYDYSFHPRQDYLSFEGRKVLYAGPFEHAVTGVGVNEGSIYIHDPLAGAFWVDKATFEDSYRTYNWMAVILD